MSVYKTPLHLNATILIFFYEREDVYIQQFRR